MLTDTIFFNKLKKKKGIKLTCLREDSLLVL